MYTFPEKHIWSYTWDAMDDLSSVPKENIIDYLLDRLQKGQIYTWVGGTLLLAINPNDEISTEDIYDLSKVDEYKNVCNIAYKKVVPHIFAVAAAAEYRVIHQLGKPNQVIVLNGETGAGKTFNAWKVLEFLTASNKNVSSNTEKQDICDIVQRISSAYYLISTFTSAPMNSNENSSRHVQLTWLEYKMGRLCGARICSYLLDKNRVTQNCQCKFRVLIEMTLTESRSKLKDILQAMDVLNFADDQKKNILKVLGLVIFMSDIQFKQEDDYFKIDTDNRQSKIVFKEACKLACLKEEDMSKLLTSILIYPQISWRGQPECRRYLNTNDACRQRLHSIIRHLYDLLFKWLINTVNNFLSAQFFSERLGILDIFGFECFNNNGIEQLCVNYVNEKLQQYFMEKYIESRRKILQTEGFITDEEQSVTIVQLYEYRLNAIEELLFTTINDLCLSIVPNDSSILIRQIEVNSCPTTKRFLKANNENFVIQHYAGAVEYSVNDFLSKNMDKIPDELIKTFELSTNEFLYELITQTKQHDVGKAKKPMMLSKLRYNVDLLIEELNKCDMHYVRCIKPWRLTDNAWDRDKLYRQLANTGILDALPLAECKYSIYFNYREFFERYCMKRKTEFSGSMMCNILKSFDLTFDDDNSMYYGKRLVFLTEPLFLQLESIRRQRFVECVKKIESFWIKHRSPRQQNIKDTNIQYVDVLRTTDTYKLLEFYVDKLNNQHKQNQLHIMQTYTPLINPSVIPDLLKNARIEQWLDNVHQKMDIQDIEFSIPEQPSTSHDCNQIIDTDSSQNILLQHNQYTSSRGSNLQKRGIDQVDSEDYSKQNINKKMNIQNTKLSIPEQPSTSHDCNQFIDTDCSQNILDLNQMDFGDYNEQDIHKEMDIQNTEFLIPEQPSTSHDCNQFIDTDCSQNILNIDQIDFEDYNEQDIHKEMDIQNIEFSISEPSTSHDCNQLIDTDCTQNILDLDQVDFGDYNKQDIHKEMDIQNTEFSIPEQPSASHDCNQFIDTDCSQNILSQCNQYTSSNSGKRHKQSKYQMNFGNYNKDEDVYIIQDSTYTLFYKDRILSRHRPAKQPVKVHTRLTCLTNSHYIVHTELPQGLQDCL